jgi:hypothetical protein
VVEYWKGGRREEWKGGRAEDWKNVEKLAVLALMENFERCPGAGRVHNESGRLVIACEHIGIPGFDKFPLANAGYLAKA